MVSWLSYLHKRNWYCPNLLDFNESFEEMNKMHERTKTIKKLKNPSRQNLQPKLLHLVASRTSLNILPARSALVNIRYGDARFSRKKPYSKGEVFRKTFSCLVQTAFFLFGRRETSFLPEKLRRKLFSFSASVEDIGGLLQIIELIV